MHKQFIREHIDTWHKHRTAQEQDPVSACMCFVHVMWKASEEVLNLAKNKLTDIGCLNAMKDACLRS